MLLQLLLQLLLLWGPCCYVCAAAVAAGMY
jgi:hypothetical protein